jgi:hypothetical protein
MEILMSSSSKEIPGREGLREGCAHTHLKACIFKTVLKWDTEQRGRGQNLNILKKRT